MILVQRFIWTMTSFYPYFIFFLSFLSFSLPPHRQLRVLACAVAGVPKVPSGHFGDDQSTEHMSFDSFAILGFELPLLLGVKNENEKKYRTRHKF
jgi:hypothetical protein